MPTTLSAVLDRLLEPVADCFSRQGAQRIVALRADKMTQDRLDELSAKSTEAELTDAERREYATYVEAINFIGVLQAKARRFLASQAEL